MQRQKHRFYLEKPARKWDEGLPLGNGRLGAMVMGKIQDETILFNEETLVYGPDRTRENSCGLDHLNEIRQLLLEGKVEQAGFLAKMTLASTPKYNNPYQPLCELRLSFQGSVEKVTSYRRSLDLDQAVATVVFQADGVTYERQHFISSKYQVFAMRIRALNGEHITMQANLNRKPFEMFTGALDPHTCGNWGRNGQEGMHYLSGARIAGMNAKSLGDFVYAEDQKELMLYVAGATDYEDCIKGCQKEDETAYAQLKKLIIERLELAEQTGYEKILKDHLLEYGQLYQNFTLQIQEPQRAYEEMPANKLIELVREKDQKACLYVTNLLVAYARYLMLSSSRNCLLPANLQGLWSGSYEPPWQCEYTININTEMNYWFVEKAGLSQCHLPLFELLKLLAEHGRKTAALLYGSRGFCAHHNTTVWGCTAPEGIFDASPYWVMGGAWLCLHLYEHYRYTGDLKFLKEEALPLMRESLRFFEDYLYHMPDGSLVTGPVVSPENTYRSPAGQVGALCMGTTMDNSILRQLILSYLEGLDVLQMEAYKDREILGTMFSHIPLLQLGPDGRILEWMEPYEEMEPGHRHISHLYGLHPGHEIMPENPELFQGAKKTLNHRLANGGGHTGWSRAWLACFAARLQEGQAVAEHMEALIAKCMQDNLLDVHPPFQIDGNFGMAEAVLESLVQQRNGVLHLLPALPELWDQGSIEGYCLPEGGRLSMTWKDSQVQETKLWYPDKRTVEIQANGCQRQCFIEADQICVVEWK